MLFFTKHPDGSFRAHNATIVGDVSAGERSSFWFSAIADGTRKKNFLRDRLNLI